MKSKAPKSVRMWETLYIRAKEREAKFQNRISHMRKVLKQKELQVAELEARLENARDTIATMQARLNTARNMAGAFVMGKTA